MPVKVLPLFLVLMVAFETTWACSADVGPRPVTSEVFVLEDQVRLATLPDDPLGQAIDVVAWGDHIAVSDGLGQNIKVFDHGGKLVSTLGRGGDGPGEFRFPTLLAVDVDDRLTVLDAKHTRVSFFGRDGQLADQFVLQAGYAWGLAPLNGGNSFVITAKMVDTETGTVASPKLAHVFDRRGNEEFTFGEWPEASMRSETPYMSVVMTVVDSTAVWGVMGRHAIHMRRLRANSTADGLVDTLLFATSSAPDWSEAPDDDFEELTAWAFRKELMMGVFPGPGVAVVRLQGGNPRANEQWYRYVVVDVEAKRVVAVSEPTPNFVQRWAGGTWLGVTIDEDGEAYLRRYRLRSGITSGSLPP